MWHTIVVYCWALRFVQQAWVCHTDILLGKGVSADVFFCYGYERLHFFTSVRRAAEHTQQAKANSQQPVEHGRNMRITLLCSETGKMSATAKDYCYY